MNISSFPTLILRHQRENLKKCSLHGLEGRLDFHFLSYPCDELPDISQYVLLDLEGAPLSQKDASKGIFLLDATWRYALKMRSFVNRKATAPIQLRSIPSGFRTAYPRYQTDCLDPEAGLASIEALYVAYVMTGRNSEGLLDQYYWKEAFLEKNKLLL